MNFENSIKLITTNDVVFKSKPSSSHSLLTTSSLSNSTVILLNWVTPSRKKLIRSTNIKLNIMWPILTLDPVPCCHIVNHWQISNRNWISPRCQKKTWTQQWRMFCKSDSTEKVINRNVSSITLRRSENWTLALVQLSAHKSYYFQVYLANLMYSCIRNAAV